MNQGLWKIHIPTEGLRKFIFDAKPFTVLNFSTRKGGV